MDEAMERYPDAVTHVNRLVERRLSRTLSFTLHPKGGSGSPLSQSGADLPGLDLSTSAMRTSLNRMDASGHYASVDKWNTYTIAHELSQEDDGKVRACPCPCP